MAEVPQIVENHRLVVNRSATDTQIDVMCRCGDEIELAPYVPLRDEKLAPTVCTGCGRSYYVRTYVLMEEPRAQPT